MSKFTRKMRSLRRAAALLAALALLMAPATLAEDTPGTAPTFGTDPAPTLDQARTVHVDRDPEHLTVANPTVLTGRFFSDMWGVGTSDIDVRALLHGYDLIRWNGNGGAFEVDPSVVSGIAVMENGAGDRTYALVLYDDLLYSDGTPITAWDYAFSFLLRASAQIADLGGVPDRLDYLAGCEAYLRDVRPLKGTELVRLDDGSLAERVLAVKTGDGGAGEATLAALRASLGIEGEIVLAVDGEGDLVYPAQALPGALQVRADADGVIADWRYRDGVRVFADGTHPRLFGVRVLADDALLITVDHEYLPFFYELGLLACEPWPIGEIAPGVEVRDDGDGVYLANRAGEGEGDPDAPRYTAQLLDRTILDEQAGYLSHPRVVSGPYRLTAYDGATAEFERNDYFKGDADGNLPGIRRITYTLGDNGTLVEKLATGEYDLLNKVTRTDVMQAAMALLRTGAFLRAGEAGEAEEWHSSDGFRMSNYPRTGLSHIAFRCERPGVADVVVRQAVAWCMDRDAITAEYTGGTGMRVDGYYGMGQWMVGLADGTAPAPVEAPEDEDDAAQTAYEAQLAEWEALSLDGLTAYGMDPDRAAALLEADGWRLNDDGVRERDGVALDLVLVYPEGNAIAGALEAHMAAGLEQAGIRLTLAPLPMEELLRLYYRQSGGPVAVTGEDGQTQLREPDMIYLASNFERIFDPAQHFLAEAGSHDWAYTKNGDETLYQLALDMRHTEPGDLLGYVKRWIAFQERFNETLPMIPIYTNVYFDFYPEQLRGYDIDQDATWSQAILGATIGAEAAEEVTQPIALEDSAFEVIEDGAAD